MCLVAPLEGMQMRIQNALIFSTRPGVLEWITPLRDGVEQRADGEPDHPQSCRNASSQLSLQTLEGSSICANQAANEGRFISLLSPPSVLGCCPAPASAGLPPRAIQIQDDNLKAGGPCGTRVHITPIPEKEADTVRADRCDEAEQVSSPINESCIIP
jgi:hypothetical protein